MPETTPPKTTLSRSTKTGAETVMAILGDVHFWIPALVLAGGVGLLVFLH